MKPPQHLSPGEWKVDHEPGYGVEIVRANSQLLADVYGNTDKEVEANVRLIAASKKIAEAATVLIDLLGERPCSSLGKKELEAFDELGNALLEAGWTYEPF